MQRLMRPKTSEQNTAVNEFLSEMKKGQMGQIDNKTTISGSRTLSDSSATHIDVDHM